MKPANDHFYQGDWPKDSLYQCHLCENWIAYQDLQRVELDARGNWHLVCQGCLEHLEWLDVVGREM